MLIKDGTDLSNLMFDLKNVFVTLYHCVGPHFMSYIYTYIYKKMLADHFDLF